MPVVAVSIARSDGIEMMKALAGNFLAISLSPGLRRSTAGCCTGAWAQPAVSGVGHTLALMKFPTSRAKLARAEEHRLSIVPEIEAYATGGNRIHLDRTDNLGKVREPIRVDYKVRKVDRPPESWALVAGDVIQNARAALDHAVWALVVKRKGENFALANYRQIQFPIGDDPGRFPEQALLNLGLKEQVVAAIRDVQPFNHLKPHIHALWFLRELSNIDKHRMLHLIVLIPEGLRLQTAPPIPNGKLTIETRGALYKGAPALTFTAPRPAHVVGRVKIDIQLNAGICFEATPTTAATAINVALEAMINEATHVIDTLEAASSPPKRTRAR